MLKYFNLIIEEENKKDIQLVEYITELIVLYRKNFIAVFFLDQKKRSLNRKIREFK